MYGSNGELPSRLDDERRYFESTWPYFETKDRQFESPAPIPGERKIHGRGISESVLGKIYFENAARLLKWKPPVGQPIGAPSAPASVPAPTPPTG
jgi:hypothetical protein